MLLKHRKEMSASSTTTTTATSPQSSTLKTRKAVFLESYCMRCRWIIPGIWHLLLDQDESCAAGPLEYEALLFSD